MEDAYSKSVAEVLEAFGVDRTKGLSDSQVEQHARLYGKNVLPQEESTPFCKLVLKQFDDLLVKILIVAAVVSFLLARMNGETGLSAFLEPSVIFMILVANATVGVITETNAEKALEELRAYQADTATVLRNGCFSILPAKELVPGDIVEVGVGCKVPADTRMVEMLSHQLRVDQAILTGESCSVAKEIESTSAMNAVYQDKTNIIFSGTVVVAGRARAVVIGVAMLRTEDEATPLKKKLDEFGTFLSKVIAGICILVWVVNIGHFRDPSHGGFVRGAIHYFKVNFDSCSTRRTSYPCSIFEGHHPSTVSMSVLVVVEMFNALNNLSENQSLLVIYPWSNLWLVGSIVLTMLLHIAVLYIEPLSALFSVSPLSWAEWKVVLYLSFPVILIDEVLKFFSRSPRGRRFPFRLWRREILPKKSRDK